MTPICNNLSTLLELSNHFVRLPEPLNPTANHTIAKPSPGRCRSATRNETSEPNGTRGASRPKTSRPAYRFFSPLLRKAAESTIFLVPLGNHSPLARFPRDAAGSTGLDRKSVV